MDADDTKCHPDAEEGSRPAKSEARMAETERTIHRFHRLRRFWVRMPRTGEDQPRMSADGHGLSPESNPNPASPGAAFANGCQKPADLRTEAAERNNVAKTTILHACSTDSTSVRHGQNNRRLRR